MEDTVTVAEKPTKPDNEVVIPFVGSEAGATSAPEPEVKKEPEAKGKEKAAPEAKAPEAKKAPVTAAPAKAAPKPAPAKPVAAKKKK